VFLGGYAALLVVHLVLASSWGGLSALLTVLVRYGVCYAATDGVLMAVAGPLLPGELRTTGPALIQTGRRSPTWSRRCCSGWPGSGGRGGRDPAVVVAAALP
jgi:hypothetical protein